MGSSRTRGDGPRGGAGNRACSSAQVTTRLGRSLEYPGARALSIDRPETSLRRAELIRGRGS